MRSCLMFAVQADGTELLTVEGLSSKNELSALQNAFWEHHALQCGFCTPGFLMTAQELIESQQRLTEKDIREALSGNLCRCTGYQTIVEAVRDLIDRKQKERVEQSRG